MRLVGFTIEIYYDARPYERQKCLRQLLYISGLLTTPQLNDYV